MQTIVDYLPGILLAYGVFGIGLISPGPNILAIVGTSMGDGRPAGRALALGISTGSLLWGMLTLSGLTAVLSLYASLITAIKIAGGLYLIWLGLRALRSACTPDRALPRTIAGAGGRLTMFRRGLLIQLTNPKAALTWIAGMSFALDGNAPWAVGAVVVAGTVAVTTAAHLAYAMAFSTAPVVSVYRRLRRWIDAALGVFFCVAGFKLLTSRA